MCVVEGCDKKVYGRGMCRGHYMRERRHGSALGGIPSRAPKGKPLAWLMEHTGHTGNECLIWPFSKGKSGGTIAMPGKTSTPAHRLMCRLVHGDPPDESYEAAHSCGKGHLACVNPQHLRWDTPLGNTADRAIHGTNRPGSSNGSSRLTEDQVLEIRHLAGSMSQDKIAGRFGVGQSTVSSIVLRRSWQHV